MDIITNIDTPLDGKQYPDTITSVTKISDQIFDFFSEKLTLRIYLIASKIVRVRYAVKGYFEKDFSYAIDEEYRFKHPEFKYTEQEECYELSSKDIKVIICKKNFKVQFEDRFGKVLNEDEKGYHWEENLQHGGHMVYCCKTRQTEECYYGLGDKPTDLNLHNKRLTNWCTDTYGFEKDHDPIYRAIPFFFGMHDSTAYGIFFDNSFRTSFDFGQEDKNVVSFWADGGEMNYYFIYGPDLDEVAESYVLLTGRPKLPPKWALGFHQCKWSYYPESQVKEIAQQFRSRQIPCDSIYLDIDYMDGFRCFTWNKEHFPDPKRLISELKEDGFKTVVIIDPGIKVDKDYWVWQQGWELDMFCKRSDGPLMTGSVWPGECNFPDFTHPKVRSWWAGLFQEYYDMGVDGVWNDMNEPAVFGMGTFPNDVRHNYDGHYCSHRKAHNVYGMQMARASKAGFEKFKPNQRPFQITRSSYSGFQRYACVWTGDNISTWDHLWLASAQIQRLSISGVSFSGTDVGGFIGVPDGELFTRWIQLSFLHTFFRAHSSGDKGEKEPWVFGKAYEVIIKKFIELRYQLIPYIYTNFYFYATQGTPMLKPLVFEDQFDPETQYRQDEFLVGNHILSCPVAKQGAVGRWLYLPNGLWYNYFTNQLSSGGVELYCDTGLEETPLYVRAGAIIPFYPVQQYIGEKKIETVTLKVYFSPDKIISYYYDDAGEGFEYEQGQYVLAKFESSFQVKSNLYKITQERSGTGQTAVSQYELVLIGFDKAYSMIKVDSGPAQVLHSNTHLLVNSNFKEITIE